jgi:hypothetical protein
VLMLPRFRELQLMMHDETADLHKQQIKAKVYSAPENVIWCPQMRIKLPLGYGRHSHGSNTHKLMDVAKKCHIDADKCCSRSCLGTFKWASCSRLSKFVKALLVASIAEAL